MSDNHTDIVRLLLAHSDIQIDITYGLGYTALHAACDYNSVESVRLFLAHPACTKDIVNMVGMDGTAERMAENKGYTECARLVREYLEKVDKPQEERSIDNIIK